MLTNNSIDLFLTRVACLCNPLPSISFPRRLSYAASPPFLQRRFRVGGDRRRVIQKLCFSHPPIARTRFSPPMEPRYPVLLFDVMGTIVRDPFYEDVPAFFGISMKELLAIKHPTAWVEFEKGVITEEELICNFFKDKREFDSTGTKSSSLTACKTIYGICFHILCLVPGLKACMANGYAYLEGVEALLDRLKSSGYQMHAFSNYSSWYELIEEKLKLSQYLHWSFVSCHTGKRKPDPDAFLEVTKQLGLRPSDIIFIDDQSRNVEAAIQIGMTALTFESAKQLENDLLTLGLAV